MVLHLFSSLLSRNIILDHARQPAKRSLMVLLPHLPLVLLRLKGLVLNPLYGQILKVFSGNLLIILTPVLLRITVLLRI